jgi:hypothetical protein
MKSTAKASRSPWRVAFSSPDCGENPMVVSMDVPRSIAHIDELPPMWQLIRRAWRPSSSAQRSATYWCDAPWNPYFITPSARHSAGTPYWLA